MVTCTILLIIIINQLKNHPFEINVSTNIFNIHILNKKRHINKRILFIKPAEM